MPQRPSGVVDRRRWGGLRDDESGAVQGQGGVAQERSFADRQDHRCCRLRGTEQSRGEQATALVYTVRSDLHGQPWPNCVAQRKWTLHWVNKMAKRQQRVSNLRPYAVIGAEQRLLQIAEEARAIFRAFPELRAANRGFGARSGGESPFPLGPQAAEGGGLVGNVRKRKRRKSKMSAAARKRISEAQKARWAKQKRTGK